MNVLPYRKGFNKYLLKYKTFKVKKHKTSFKQNEMYEITSTSNEMYQIVSLPYFRIQRNQSLAQEKKVEMIVDVVINNNSQQKQSQNNNLFKMSSQLKCCQLNYAF